MLQSYCTSDDLPYQKLRFVEGMDSVDDLERYSPPPLMCLFEEQSLSSSIDGRVCIAMIAVCPSTGDVVWDEFHGVFLSSFHLPL